MKKHLLSPLFIVIAISFAMMAILASRFTERPDKYEYMPDPAVQMDTQPPKGEEYAYFWQKMEGGKVLCELCPHFCIIPDGLRGRCRVRENRSGKLYSLVYGKPVAISMGPIEKAPFHHFYPGHRRRTIATAGCNLICLHCQNWPISQGSVDELKYWPITPEEMILGVLDDDLTSVSFTYTEPTVFFEYMYDIAKLAKEKGLKTNLVTNGFINPEPLRQLLRYMDAVRVDLKAFTEEFYTEISSGRLEPVLEALKIIHEEGVHLEIINLVIPTLNDDQDDIRRMSEWIIKYLSPDVPLHFNRFFPQFKLTDLPATPVETLERAAFTAREAGLRFVYIGNVAGHPYNNTFCPECGEMVIKRSALAVLSNKVIEGKCGYCGYSLPGEW
jgi:pyruvate formate lyase activating enzyme